MDEYLQYEEVVGLTVPRPNADKGLVLNGRMPHWLLTGLVRLYWSLPDELPFLAIFQPQVGNIVIASRRPDLPPGALL